MGRRRTRGRAAPKPLRTAVSQVERVMELPSGTLGSDAHLEIWGGRRAVVENCRGVLEYEEGVIRLNTTGGEIRLTGTALDLTALTDNEAVVSGHISSVEFL